MTKKLAKLQKRKAALITAMRELSEAADADDRDLTDAEQSAFNDNKAELDAVLAAIDREEYLIEAERSMIDEGEPLESDVDPNQGQADSKKWKSFGDFLSAVAMASGAGAHVDQRLVRPGAITGMGELIGSEGGFLVQTDFVQELFTLAHDASVIVNGGPGYAGVAKVPISSNSNGVKLKAVNETSRADGSRWGGIRAYWEEEGATATATKPDFRQIELSLKKLMAICYATEELLADASALEAVVRQGYSEEASFKVQDALVNGDGAGKPLGILAAPCIVEVAKESGQTATTIVAENIHKMYARLWARSIPRSVWHVNQDCWPQLFGLNEGGDSDRYLFLPPGGISAAPYGSLMGRPIVPIEQCQTLGTAGDILLCDWSQYLLADKGGLNAQSSMHVRFIYDEMTYKFTYRVDGQPAWSSALTPFKGSNTQGPFVSLATRS